MKFTLVKLSAFALVATHAASAKESPKIQLRGAIPLEGGKNEFFPKSDESEMIQESEDRNPSKNNASQKRQNNRDNRRSRQNPGRSQEEEQKERERKHRQASQRSNRCTDPSEPGCGNDNHPRNREAKRQYECETNGNNCKYHRASPKDEPNKRRANRDMDCIDNCDYDNDDRSDRDRCVKRNCDGTKWIFNGAATYGEYMDLLFEEAFPEPKEDGKKMFPWKEVVTAQE